MNRSKKKAFDWYGMRQHFSIRKYHFGAASVLLGMSLALGSGAQVVKAQEAANSTEPSSSTLAEVAETSTSSTQVEVVESSTSSTQAEVTETTVASSETATESSSSSETATETTPSDEEVQGRIATVNYIVSYVTEDGVALKVDFLSVLVPTQDAVAKSSFAVKAQIPEGYELATGQEASVTVEVTEGGANVVTFKLVKKSEAKTEETTATEAAPATESKASETTSPATEEKAASEATATTPTVPTTVSEAKTVLEQVVSEATVLAEEAERQTLIAQDSNEAVKLATVSTKESVKEAAVVFNNALATLDEVNTQIAAVRTNVEALALELRKFLGKDELTIALSPTDNMDFTTNAQTNITTLNNIYNKGDLGTSYNAAYQVRVLERGLSGYDQVIANEGKFAYITSAENKAKYKSDLDQIQIIVKSFQYGPGDRIGFDANKPDGGRVDYPLTYEQNKALEEEAVLWNQLPSAQRIKESGETFKTLYGAGGTYEYLAYEIYGYVYEQVKDKVYIPNYSQRFDLSESAKAAGWSITALYPNNLPTGLKYISGLDSIEGYIMANGDVENSVQDIRPRLFITNGQRTYLIQFGSMQGGWIAGMDTTAPEIILDGSVSYHTVGDTFSKSIEYKDATNDDVVDSTTGLPVSNTATASNGSTKYTFTASDGSKQVADAKIRQAMTGVAGLNATDTKPTVDSVIPGANYSGQTGNITGTLTEAGIYTVTVYAKDYDINLKNNAGFINSPQEVNTSVTFVVAPKVEVKNIETYSSVVPVTISAGATSAKMTMPDGTTTLLEVNAAGNWVVATGGTNTAAVVGTELGAVGSEINIPVTSDNSAKAGVDNITVETTTERVKATIMRKTVTVTDNAGKTYTATHNNSTGHWELPAESAKETNGSDVTERKIWTKTNADGSEEFWLYEFTRTYDGTGKVTAVKDVYRTLTSYANKSVSTNHNAMYVTVTYDPVTKTWTSSDDTAVTAVKGSNGYSVSTASGFGGTAHATIATSTDVGSIENSKPTATSTSYVSTKGTVVDLVNATQAGVAISDPEDTVHSKVTSITKVKVTSPTGVVTEFNTVADAKAYAAANGYTLTEVGTYKIDIDVIDSNGNYVDAVIGGLASGTDAGPNTSVATTTYYITVYELKGTDVTSAAAAGVAQTGTPTFALVNDTTNTPNVPAPTFTGYTLVGADASGAVTVAGEGTYTINAQTGAVTFTPVDGFVGTATGVTVQATATVVDPQTSTTATVQATAKYTPTVYGLTSVPSTTEDIQGKTQTSPAGSEVFKSLNNPTNTSLGYQSVVIPSKGAYTLEDGTLTKPVDGEGTYTINPDTGVVTFVPVASFKGTGTGVTIKVTAQAVDSEGNTITVTDTDTYTPNVTPVTPTATPVETTDIQGKTQSGTPVFTPGHKEVPMDDTVPATFEDGTTEKVIPGEGTYTVAPDGTVTFVPEKDFTGTGTGVTVKRVDKNGTPATATYTPNVTPVTPTATPVETTDIQGKTQSGTPV
ncbi:TPA: YSIRK-type signal peptide-containing protein, partial [Streptococcus suis]